MEEIGNFLIKNFFYVLGPVSLLVIYYYITRNHNYWKNRGINGPKPLPLFGNFYDSLTQPAGESFERNIRRFGNVYGYYEWSKPFLVIAEPELIKFVTVKEFQCFRNRQKFPFKHRVISQFLSFLRDAEWKRVRAILSPAFTSGKIKKMFELMFTCVDDLLAKIEQSNREQVDLDMKKVFGAYSMDVIAKCAFATKTNAQREENNPFVRNALMLFKVKIWRFLLIMITPKFLINYTQFTPTSNSIFRFFENVCVHLIEQRRKSNEKPHDFLQLMLDAERKENSLINDIKDINNALVNDEDNEQLERNVRSLMHSEGEKKLTTANIVANATLFFAAGYETTATLLTFAAYALAKHLNVQEKLFKEISAHDEITYEMINKLEYLHAFICEVLRLYNPVTMIEREAARDCELPAIKLKIEKGTVIRIPVSAVHKNEQYFENAEKFIPERFLSNEISKIQPYTFLPFGVGLRNCIGMRFALIEVKLALCKALLKYRFLNASEHDTELHFVRNSISALRITSKPVWLKFEQRMNKKN